MNTSLILSDVCLEVRSNPKGIKSKFGNNRSSSEMIINNVSLTLKGGDRVALVGDNGAGKSTLLRIMGLAIPPSRGLVSASHQPTNLLGSASTGLDKMLTGLEAIRIFQVQNMIGKQSRKNFTQDVVEFCELDMKITDPIYTYSSGMQARLKFALVTALNPTILLQDENIFPSFDSTFRQKAEERLISLHKNVGIFVCASHNTRDFSTCNRLLKLSAGVIEFYKEVSPSDLRALVRSRKILSEPLSD